MACALARQAKEVTPATEIEQERLQCRLDANGNGSGRVDSALERPLSVTLLDGRSRPHSVNTPHRAFRLDLPVSNPSPISNPTTAPNRPSKADESCANVVRITIAASC